MSGSWVAGADGSGYGIEHLPYGVYRRGGGAPRVGVRIGALVLDLAAALPDGPRGSAFAAPSLNRFLALGPPAWRAARERVTTLLADERNRRAVEPHLVPLAEVSMQLPIEVADYVDFYASLEHASNVGRIFRPDSAALPAAWRDLPIGYHGRSGTVVVSGTPVRRPSGQLGRDASGEVRYGPSQRLDIEAELAFVVGAPSEVGRPVGTGDFAGHVFGVALLNDWSARDIQRFEYVPLGPFLGKSFATSLAAWITPLEALAAARLPGRTQRPAPLPYLTRAQPWGLDIDLEIALGGATVARPRYRGMYWTPDQMLAHLTSGGAPVRTGDLFASGTVSGDGADQRGSLLELSRGGQAPLRLPDGTERSFLADGDAVTISASAPAAGGGRLTLSEVSGTIAGS